MPVDNRMMAAPDRTHYDVLGITRDADAATIRSAWKLHVQAWHPDRFNGDTREHAERQTSRINEAYTVLRDQSRRAAYDCRLAADELAARPEPPRRAATAAPVNPRPSAAPVGSPMVHAEPLTASDQLAVAARDALATIRRHPRITAAAVAIWAVVFGSSAVLHLVAGPTLPSSASAATAAPVSAIVASDEQVEDLEELAERAREEAAEADAQMAAMLREDAARAEAEARQAARADARAAALARRGAKRRGATGRASAANPGRRIVRVMPSVAMR